MHIVNHKWTSPKAIGNQRETDVRLDYAFPKDTLLEGW